VGSRCAYWLHSVHRRFLFGLEMGEPVNTRIASSLRSRAKAIVAVLTSLSAITSRGLSLLGRLGLRWRSVRPADQATDGMCWIRPSGAICAAVATSPSVNRPHRTCKCAAMLCRYAPRFSGGKRAAAVMTICN
jgi:hypothetical protein